MNSQSQADLPGGRWLTGIALCVGLVGCVNMPDQDWNSRLGTYTRDMALADFGEPAQRQALSDGREVLGWVRTDALQNPWPGQPVSRDSIFNDTPGAAPNRVLHLTFGPDGKLVDWNQSY